MNRILFITLLSTALLSACKNNGDSSADKSNGKDTTLKYFGDTISMDGAIKADQLTATMKGKDSLKIKLAGKIEAVCQKKGCWMKMNIGSDKEMMVRFKDYAFFVPKDISGKEAFIDGVAFCDTVSIADRKHYAEDAGKSKEEIENITAPEVNIGFEARGVIIKK